MSKDTQAEFKTGIKPLLKRLAAVETINHPTITEIETDARQLPCGRWFYDSITFTAKDVYTLFGKKTTVLYSAIYDGAKLSLTDIERSSIDT